MALICQDLFHRLYHSAAVQYHKIDPCTGTLVHWLRPSSASLLLLGRPRSQRDPVKLPCGIRCSAATTMDQSLLLALPDDALLAVLACLPARHLLSCRLACRRLRDLCQHPDLWRSVRLKASEDCQLVRAALRFAPCLCELDLIGMNMDVEEPDLSACAVAKLVVELTGHKFVARTTAMLRKQSALGALRELTLQFDDDFTSEPMQTEWNISTLLGAVCNANSLRSLTIENISEVPLLASLGDLEGGSFLQELSYLSFSDDDDTLHEALMKAHAATLEHVHLNTRDFPVSDLKVLPNLVSLDLGDVGWVYSVSPEVPKLLRGASSQLRSVVISYTDPSNAELLLALAASPAARDLETLRVYSESNDVFGHMAAALPQFPALQSLTISVCCRPENGDLKHFLRALSPMTAPSLTELILRPPRKVCLDALLHDSAVTDLLRRNPRLHFHVQFNSLARCRHCLWCGSDFYTRQVALAAHCREAGGPADCRQTAG
ncbi:uncharacterized protein LOC117642417 isoform X3 [Thrips palmi]|uniref:Uncharacterized protein LOC117642417 isoform X3 n=1 Tax=Thrips palmi TaxID=161013 RepID=A0A6P8ZK51_THRPL|nr:uncharacterized protein LOC117642417 isoform X3 [Thrips palmi]